MDALLNIIGLDLLIASMMIAVFAGVIKGMVGFGVPMVLVSGLSTFLTPEWALAGLILPTLVTNGIQALRQGAHAALQSVKRFRVFLIAGGITLFISAQFVRYLPDDTFLLLVGIPVTVFASIQLFGVTFNLSHRSRLIEGIVGAVTGMIGGISAVWGPPTASYLTALGTEKKEQIRIQGVIYGLGAILLAIAHIGSGIVRAETIPFSIALLPPALAGLWVGGRIQDRIDQSTFRIASLVFLTIAGLNLIRRALF